MSVVPNGNATATVSLSPTNGFNGKVSVSISKLPAGVSVDPSSFDLTLSGAPQSQAITVAASPDVQVGNAQVQVSGVGNNAQASANVTLQVQAIPVTTWHYDNQRTGANLHENRLTLANVNQNSFGKLFTLPVDGAIVGQVLYLPNVTIGGKGTHNVIYAATMHDSVYAFDADSNGSPLWQTSLLPASATPMPIDVQGCQGVTQWTEVGIVSTPVIDESTGTLYVATKSYENATPIFRLHALDIQSGNEKLGGPVEISASFTLNGHTDTFSPLAEINRPALLLANGHLYLAFGSNGCNAFGVQGWVLSYNAATLAQEGTFNTEPGQALASIWLKGAGLSTDDGGNVFGESGEGSFNPGTNFGSSIFKLAQSGTNLQLADWFTPYNQAFLNSNDMDLNDSVLILPDQAGPHVHLAVGIGKEGTLYLLDRDNMGHFCDTCTAGDTQIVQEIPGIAGKATGALVYWNSRIYSTGVGAPVMAWALNNGLLSEVPVVQSAVGDGGHSPVLTAIADNNAILWQVNGSNLTAYDALSLNELYESALTNGRDDLPPLPHFAQIMVVNGKLYVGTNDSIAVFGLF